MEKTRVHDLAKEYGMTSKEMLEHLQAMKIPAKSPSSTLEYAYVSIVRKKLKPILEAHAAEIEAARKAEEESRDSFSNQAETNPAGQNANLCVDSDAASINCGQDYEGFLKVFMSL